MRQDGTSDQTSKETKHRNIETTKHRNIETTKHQTIVSEIRLTFPRTEAADAVESESAAVKTLAKDWNFMV